jgi:homoaconitase/3-isopropylmalate dehydratase large subunit
MPWRSSLPHTLAEKILLAHSDVDELRPGDVVTVRCDVVMANDVSGPVAFRAMERMGATRVFDPERVVMVADHFVPAKDARSAELQRRLETWSREQGVAFYGQGRGGIEHTLLCEEGWVTPGSVIAGGDAHLHLRRSRIVRHRARLDGHRVLSRARLVLAAGAGDDRRGARRQSGGVRDG